ncbi:MAG TPA: EAL domain-containing protein [Pseudonocardiaceae bacterium]|jgi:diguanylate cyclase (GGDEF)-like protein/PAS domain S-box-containing protein|nr:EAL domain-containing protein [Pseudonocardiaceae bacterium]
MSATVPPEPGLTVAGLAQTWAVVASRSAYLPMSGDEVEQLLTRLINRLVAAVAGVPVDERAAIEVAAELVAHDLTGSSSIGRSIEVLGEGLPRLAELHVGRGDAAVVRVLGALAGGYAGALRQRTLDEQNQVTQALLQAKLDAERDLQVSETRFRRIFSEAPVGIAISDLDGTVVAANRAFAGMVGRTPDDLIGAALPELLHTEDDPTLGAAYQKLAGGELTRVRDRGRLTATGGEGTWVFLAGFLLRDPDGVATHHVVIADDVTELLLLQKELSAQALHDRLTGLPNEHYFMSYLQDVLEGADPSVQVTVCRVNLDGFSVINDGIGRSAGELLLRSVAGRLQELVIGKRAMVARMGADDFAILLEGDMDRRALSLFATTINARLCEPVYIDDRGISVSAGVGVVSQPAGGISAGELIRAADATLRRAKRTGRGQWDLYDAEHDDRQRERSHLAAEIPGAWECGEIDVEYQPVCRLDGGRIVALQALLRWDRADGAVLGHSECLALAEQTGLVVSLGNWIVEKTCSVHIQVLARCRELAPLLRVDLTAQLSQDPDLVGVVRGALLATGLRAEQLRVGVPLAAVARGRGDVLDNVDTLAGLGAEVVLLGAAAGSGYMAYLEDLPVGAVEIAPEIVARIARRPGDDSVVARAVRDAIPLVHSTGATVIVPGVDTPEQAQWWRSAGADTAWGAHFGPPVPHFIDHC